MPVSARRALLAASILAFAAPAFAGKNSQGTANSTVYDPNAPKDMIQKEGGVAWTIADQMLQGPNDPPRGLQYLQPAPGEATMGGNGRVVKITPDFFGGPEAVDQMFNGPHLRPGALSEFLNTRGFQGKEAITPGVANGLMRFFEDEAKNRNRQNQPTEPAVAPQTLAPAVRHELGATLVAVQPQSPVGFQYLGTAAGEKGDNVSAVLTLTKALELGGPPEARYQRGLFASRAGDNELANSDARKVLSAEPENKEAYSLYMLTRSRPSTVKLLDGRGLAEDDGRLAAAGGAGAARPQWDGSQGGGGPDGGAAGLTPEQIAAQENAALNVRPVTARSAELTRDAKSALRVRDTKSALRLTEEAIQADPGNADARYVRATAFLQMKEPARAAYEASAGLELAPGNGPLLYTRAVANGRQKLWREAYVDAEDAVRNAPRAGYAYQVRAAANWALGRKAEMMRDLRTSAGLDRAYAAAAQRATQQPSDVDPTLLFSDEPAPAAQAAAPASAPAPAPRYALWAVGGVLAVLGLLPVFSSGVRSKVTTVFRRGPAVGEADSGGGADVPVTGFWKRYEVTREIGAGGMGVVYEAWDRQLERRAAVKRMRDEIKNDRRERERFLQEARMVARLRHPNLVEIYSIEEDGPDAYLVFEFVEGQNLHEMLQEKGRFTAAEARDVFRGLCAGVDYAHRQGVVHRDLKPANVIVEPDGTVKVMDFGVARQAQDALARRQMTNTIIGTPQYMAPEQEEGVVCTQSDVYALGVCLYEMLAGVPPFSGSAGAVTLAKREARYEPLTRKVSDIPPAVASVVERALDPNPETRTRTAADFLKDLEAAVSNVAA
jgi:tRNA A-37 threonylcarbamoyl transferase component Bud32/tetratricopeptide (TPR) repeat protein